MIVQIFVAGGCNWIFDASAYDVSCKAGGDALTESRGPSSPRFWTIANLSKSGVKAGNGKGLFPERVLFVRVLIGMRSRRFRAKKQNGREKADDWYPF